LKSIIDGKESEDDEAGSPHAECNCENISDKGLVNDFGKNDNTN